MEKSNHLDTLSLYIGRLYLNFGEKVVHVVKQQTWYACGIVRYGYDSVFLSHACSFFILLIFYFLLFSNFSGNKWNRKQQPSFCCVKAMNCYNNIC